MCLSVVPRVAERCYSVCSRRALLSVCDCRNINWSLPKKEFWLQSLLKISTDMVVAMDWHLLDKRMLSLAMLVPRVSRVAQICQEDCFKTIHHLAVTSMGPPSSPRAGSDILPNSSSSSVSTTLFFSGLSFRYQSCWTALLSCLLLASRARTYLRP